MNSAQFTDLDLIETQTHILVDIPALILGVLLRAARRDDLLLVATGGSGSSIDLSGAACK